MYLGQALRIKASGNAYPVPLMISVLYPIMAMLKKKIPKQLPCEASLKGRDAVACCKEFQAWMQKFKDEAASAETNKKKTVMKSMKAMKMGKPAGKPTKTTTMKKKGKSTKTISKVKKTHAKTTRDSRRRTRYQYRFLSSSSSN